jgi:hypothetical protein
VDWRAPILELRAKKGYTFEQLGDLEIETELLLCGLVSPADYPRELEKRMRISRAQVDELVNDMNLLVFNKIQEELVKNVERKKIFEQQQEKQILKNSPQEEHPLGGGGISTPSGKPATPEVGNKNDTAVLSKAGIEIVPEKLELTTPIENRNEILKKIEKPEEGPHPILAQKLSGAVQTGVVKTEHTIENLTKTNTPNSTNTTATSKKVDPYREMPE